MLRSNSFLDRLLTTTSAFTDAGDTGGGSAPAADTTPAPNESDAGIGGAQEQDYDFGYSYSEPSAEETAQVSSILDSSKDQDRKLSYADIGALLGWNPALTPKAKDQPPANVPGQPPANQPPAAAAPPANQQTPPANVQAPVVDPAIKALTESVQALVNVQTPQAPANTPATAPAQPKRFYGDTNPELQVAPELVSAIIGSNQPEAIAQASPAINHLINGLANKVMEDAAKMLVYQQQQIMAHIPQAIVAHTTERTNTQKFYDRYSELNKPAFQPMVNQAAAAVVAKLQKEGRQVNYNDEFYDTVGGLVHAYIKQSMGIDIPRARQAQVGTPPIANAAPRTQAPGSKPRFVTPQGTRPPAGPSGPSQSADLRDLV